MNTVTTTPLSPHWRRALLAFALLLGWLLFWYRDTALAMAAIWSRSDTYAHGYLVPFISLWLIWRQRHRVLALAPRPGYLAWLLMAGCALLWLMGDLVAVNAATQLALTAMIVLAVPAVLGWQVAAALLFPLGFLFFAVPLGDFMMPQFMEWTADFTVLALRATGIPVYREGLEFVIPTGHWSVVEACSGIRYLIASVTVGCLFAYLNYQSTTRRLVFVLVSFVVPIVANWLRAYMIVMLGHYSGNTIATGVDHLIYGWVFFGVVIMIMFLIGARWSEAEPPLSAPVPSGAAATIPSARPANANAMAGAVLALAVLVLSPHMVNWVLQQSSSKLVPTLAVVPAQAGWQLAPEAVTDWKPAFDHPAAQLQTGYAQPNGAKVGVYVAYYRNQDYKSKLVSSENMLVRSNDPLWARVSGGSAALVFGQPVVARAAELRRLQGEMNGNEPRLLVRQFYWINGRLIASDVLAKIHGALGRLMGQGDDGAVLILYTPKQSPAGDGATVLQSFADTHAASLLAALQQTRNQR